MSDRIAVALCMPIARAVHPENFQSFRFLRKNFLNRSGNSWHHLSIIGQAVHVARNIITHEAMATPDITHLLWIDDDMVYPAESLERLLAHDLPIVGGLCFDRRHPYKPVIGRDVDPSWGADPRSVAWLYDYPPDELIDVDYTGGAFLLVKREVFQAIRAQELEEGGLAAIERLGGRESATAAYDRWWTPLPDLESEDLSFCVRARRAGYKIKVDTGLKIGHVGEVIVTEEFAKRNRQVEYNRWRPPLEALLDAQMSRKYGLDKTCEAIDQLAYGVPQAKPVATIVITAYNPKPEQLLTAVATALAQTVPCEVIVVDDGSEKPVRELLHEDLGRRVIFLRSAENKGISRALNTGIAAMTTDWFCWLPCDDYFEPTKVESQLAALLATGRLAGYHGYNIHLDNKNSVGHVETLMFTSREHQQRVLSRVCAINGTTVMLHRSVIAKVGLFNMGLKYAQDWEYWNRVAQHFDWFGMPDKLATRREFGNLTEALLKSKNPRKLEEDEIVLKRFAPKLFSPITTNLPTSPPCACVQFDDGAKFELDSFAGGGAPGGEFSTVTCRLTRPDGSSEIIRYRREP